MTLLWDKGIPVDREILEFTAGEDRVLDARLVRCDVLGTLAHIAVLARAGLLDADEHRALAAALAAIAEDPGFTIRPDEEDVHTAIERALVERCGDAGKKSHAGRSRNDQVLTAVRLWLKDTLAALAGEAAGVGLALCGVAATHREVPMPGYTHGRRAMPSSVGLWAAAHAEVLLQSLVMVRDAHLLADRCPLGSAAGYGVPLPLDRVLAARLLGFAAPQRVVTSVQPSRGKAEAAALAAAAAVTADLGRLAADLVLYTSEEHGFFRLPDELTTGSSIMPQKRNPDVLELVRAHAAALPGLWMQVTALGARLTSGYHRDLQLIKPPLFAGLDAARACCRIVRHVVPRLVPDAERLRAAMGPDLYATARALELARAGVAFRDAYRQAAAESTAGALPPPPATLPAHAVLPADELDSLRADLTAAIEWAEEASQRAAAAHTALLQSHARTLRTGDR